jgi:hypothetical protein
MAEIPVERKKGGLPWWLIPLALLLFLILLFLSLRSCDDNSGRNTNANNNANRAVSVTANSNNTSTARNSNNSGNAVGTANASGAAIPADSNEARQSGAAVSDVNYFAGINDKASLAGRSADLKNVRVNRVVSDRLFTVKAGSGEMFVLLDESLDSAGGKEKQIKIRRGQNLNIGGAFQSVPEAETREEQQRDLNQREYRRMRGQQVYLQANSVDDAGKSAAN